MIPRDRGQGGAPPDLRVGDGVTFQGEKWWVRGITPMGVTPVRIELERKNGERCEAAPDEITLRDASRDERHR